jgi:hypothetical protein
MALKLNGKDDRLNTKDFRTFARTARLEAADAGTIIETMLGQFRRAVDRVSLPSLAQYGPNGKRMAEQMLEVIGARVASF